MAPMVESVFRERRLRRRGNGRLLQLEKSGCQQGLSRQRKGRWSCRRQTLLDWIHLETNKGMERDRK